MMIRSDQTNHTAASVSAPRPRAPRAQRDYYKLNGAAAAFESRLAALRRHVLPGSVLDVGCNDGTLTGNLLHEGCVATAQGIDLEVLHCRFPVLAANILDVPIASLGDFDNVLYLNVHHHLIASTHGSDRSNAAQEILNSLLARCRRMFFEMGSVTERGTWSWLKILGTKYRRDEHAMEAFFGERLYYETLRYPMQGGIRAMFVVVGNGPDHWNVTHVQWYARNVAAYPLSKRLAKIDAPDSFPPGPVGHAPLDWMPNVKFVTFRYGGRKFFGKRHHRKKYDVSLTFKIYDQLRHTPFAQNIVQPLYFSTEYGLVWEYDPQLMMSPFGKAIVVHLHDVPRAQFGLHSGNDRQKIEELANLVIEIDGIKKSVRQWCDFQTVRTSRGLKFIDFDAF